MRVQLGQKELATLLESIARIVETKQTIPILGHVLLHADDGQLAARGTNLEIEVATQAAATVERDGEITANVHVLFDLVRKFRKDMIVTLDSDDRTLTVKAGKSTVKLPTMPAENFPPLFLSNNQASHIFSLSAPALRLLIEPIENAIAMETTRLYLTGIFLHLDDSDGIGGHSVLKAVATDSYRLALSQWHAPHGSEGMPAVIVPRRTVAELRRVLGKLDTDVTVYLSLQKIQFEIDHTIITSKLLEGTYPDYQRIIPQDNDKTLIIDKEALAEALDRVSTVGIERRGVKCKLRSGCLELTVQGLELGSATEEVDVDYDGNPLEIGFNSKYFLQCLAPLEGRIEILLGDSQTPAIVRQEGTKHPFFVMMPMRV